MYSIETSGLSKNYGKMRGIDRLELKVEEGDFFGFIGPNGAGKSTTIRTLLGLIRPSGGSGRVLGCDIGTQQGEILRRTGYLPSEVHFYRGMKGKDVVRYSASLRRAECRKKAAELAARLDLDLNRKAADLSLGNRKKLGIVCALQHSPELLILDEPTSGLDPLMQREFFAILEEENRRGATIFFSSHILSEVQNHCATAAFIKDGRIILSDRVEKLEETGTKKVSVRTAEGTESFLYRGEIRNLLQSLADRNPEDVTITEPTLEEIFLNTYREGET